MPELPLELQAARVRLTMDRPYLAAAAWALYPVARPGLGTMAVDEHWRLYYDPEVGRRWTVEQLAGVLYHEVLHLLRDHAVRMRPFPAEIGNFAADAEINDDILHEDVRLPDGCVTPQTLGMKPNLLAEEYASALMRKSAPDRAVGSGGDGGECQKSSSRGRSGTSSPKPGLATHNPGSPSHGSDSTAGGSAGGKCPTQTSAPERKPAPAQGRCGSCATGHKAAWEDGEDAPGGLPSEEADLVRREVAQRVVESKSRGTVPAHLARWADAIISPKIDWRKELAAVVRRSLADISGMTDYSYSRPSRRQHAYGDIVIPSLRAKSPEVAVVVDTSGSMGDRELAQALAEVKRVLQGVRSGVTVLAVDAEVHTCQRVFDHRQVKLAGGGGTDMCRGIERALRLRPRPHVVVVLTDGYTPWPAAAPDGVRVVVGLIGSGGESPAWARTVHIELE